MKKHTLIAIGFLSSMKCYLDIDEEEAVRRYKAENNMSNEDFIGYTVATIHFNEEFEAYDVWETE